MAKRNKPRSLYDYLTEVIDFREKQGQRFALHSILAIAVGAVLCGRTTLAGIARWGRSLATHYPDCLPQLGFENGQTPCHATLHNVFSGLGTGSLERMLSSWFKRLRDEGVANHVAVDGKTLRGSRSGTYPALHMLSAYCCGARGVLAQEPVKDKENEIVGVMRLLKGIPLKGTIVTGDAMFCQRKVCRNVVEGGGDYLFTVKDNQPSLLADIKAVFEDRPSPLRTTKASA
jgi:hypothetical protein